MVLLQLHFWNLLKVSEYFQLSLIYFDVCVCVCVYVCICKCVISEVAEKTTAYPLARL
jgi:hypothetical protein